MNDSQLDSNQDLALAIKKIVVLFDLFDYPLTQFEIYTYLEDKYSLVETILVLESLSSVIKNKEGFYFLSGRDYLVPQRKKRYNYSIRKLKIAKRYSKIFGLLPYVKVVALANVIGAHNMRDEGDIDLFIICSNNRIWLCRLFCAGLAKILNKRPTQTIKKDKLCLSFYISDEYLNLDNLKIKPYDPYFEYWLSTMVLLLDKEETYVKFLQANNLRRGYLPIDMPVIKKNGIIMNRVEFIAKAWQFKIMSPELKEVLISSKGKFINDKILKLYWRDRNAEILQKYNYALNQII